MKLTEVDHEDKPAEEAIQPGLEIVDAHHHLWPSGNVIPYDLAAMRADLDRGHNIVSTVFVECMASFRPDGEEALRPVGETEFVVESTVQETGPGSAAVAAVAAAIVSWADLSDPVQAARTLDAHLEAGAGRLRGIRYNVVWDPRVDSGAHAGRTTTAHMMLNPAYRTALAEVAQRNLTYDVWAYHPQLLEVADTADAVPDLTFVLDHLGGPVPDEATPDSRKAAFEDWRQNLAVVAQRPNVVLKLGGAALPVYGFGFDRDRPPSLQLAGILRPYVDTAIDLFGPDRCMFESNFPVDKQGYSYDSLWNAFKRITADHSAAEQSALFAGTARRVYGIETS